MKRTLIVLMMLAALAIAAVPSAGAQRLAVTANTANVRSGPGLNHDQLWQVEKYHPLLVLATNDEWYRIKDFEGDEGWVHKSLMGKLDTVIVKSNQCNIRKGPGTQFDIVFTVDKGIPFKVLQRKGNWIELEHADGDRGWILNTLIW
jgi:SH3-like domain-containing protein